ncbi:MAG: hypothetical protein HY542_06710 [Deltaproteobacteria bacterium]|nr:hypothetical protein [Deltaproteobacteria bacterium]
MAEGRELRRSTMFGSKERGLGLVAGRNHEGFNVPGLWRPEKVPVTFERDPLFTAHHAMTCEDETDPATIKASVPYRSIPVPVGDEVDALEFLPNGDLLVANTKNDRVGRYVQTNNGPWCHARPIRRKIKPRTIQNRGKYRYVVENLATQSRIAIFDISDPGQPRLTAWFGSSGSAGGQFVNPARLAMSRDGRRLAVACQGNKRVIVFEMEALLRAI